PATGGSEKLPYIHSEAVVLRARQNARNDLIARQGSVAQRQYGRGAFIELHDTRRSGQKMAVRGVLLQLASRSEPYPARPGPCFVLHGLAPLRAGPSRAQAGPWRTAARARSGPEVCQPPPQLPCARGMACLFIRRYRVFRLIPSWAATRVI